MDFSFEGITPSDWRLGVRYAVILLAQTGFTLFNILWFEAKVVKKFKVYLLTALVIVAVTLGSVAGYAFALQQNDLIDAKVP
jgi:hypothetical protein